jgi:flagellar motor switch protein FliG
MLKYMRPHQSAMVLDTLPSSKRVEVIAQLATVSELPLSKMYSIEREVRLAAQRVPQHTPGATREEADFWGEVLAESSDQESLLGDLERTNPEIFPKLAKYKFKLEDAATLPENLLQRVLGNVENDELGMALATCAQDVIEVILESVSARRRDMLLNQIDNYRTMPREQVTAARLKLTKKFREAMA